MPIPTWEEKVRAATARRRKLEGCLDKCSWWDKGGRVWHEMNCPNNPLNRRPERSEDARQNREAAALRHLNSPVHSEQEIGEEHAGGFDG